MCDVTSSACTQRTRERRNCRLMVAARRSSPPGLCLRHQLVCAAGRLSLRVHLCAVTTSLLLLAGRRPCLAVQRHGDASNDAVLRHTVAARLPLHVGCASGWAPPGFGQRVVVGLLLPGVCTGGV
jgi:hypothetical protein